MKEENGEKQHRKSNINLKRGEENNGIIKYKSKIGDPKEKIKHQKYKKK